MNEDYRDILLALKKSQARFLVVGAHAMAVHGLPRGTVDIDILIDPTPENASRVWAALAEFGAPLDALNISMRDLTQPNIVAQLGLPPNRIDILTGLTGVTFAGAWAGHVEGDVEGVRVPVLGLQQLRENKRATGRDKDRADLKGLEGKN